MTHLFLKVKPLLQPLFDQQAFSQSRPIIYNTLPVT